MVVLHVWPEGLAVVVEATGGRGAAVLDADGWRQGEAADVFPDGPPANASRHTLSVPTWLSEQLLEHTVLHAGLHTDFVKLDRLAARLRTDGGQHVLLVLGERPAAAVVTDGRVVPVGPVGPDGPPSSLDGASGWVVVLTGPVVLPPPAHPAAPSEDTAAPDARPAAPGPRGASGPGVPAARDTERGPGDERFVAARGATHLDPETAAAVRAAGGETALAVLALLDGSRTVAEVAAEIGRSADEVSAAVRVLVARRLVFRYVSRVRPPTGARPR